MDEVGFKRGILNGHDPVDEDSLGDDRLGINRSKTYDFVRLHDRRARCGRHNRIEVSCCLVVDKVSEVVGPSAFDERKVSRKAVFEHVLCLAKRTMLLALCKRRTNRR